MKAAHKIRVMNDPNANEVYRGRIVGELRDSGAIARTADTDNAISEIKLPSSFRRGEDVASKLNAGVSHGASESELNQLLDYLIANHPQSPVSPTTILNNGAAFGAPESVMHRLLDIVLAQAPDPHVQLTTVLNNGVGKSPESVLNRILDHLEANHEESRVSFTTVLNNGVAFGAPESVMHRLLDIVLAQTPDPHVRLTTVLNNGVGKSPQSVLNRILDHLETNPE